MERITRKRDDGTYVAPESAVRAEADGYSGEAIERLAAFENAIEVVEAQIASIEPRLDELKARGRIRGSEAQQLLAQKLACASTLHMLGVD